ncbi:MAG: PQQ-binding-like beta-propeller repeat protein [Sedimentisphaerales bacterium]|nr:PQQ-binding-like beta-propeller repeat protein [Sedimentisphaerales bacterium]
MRAAKLSLITAALCFFSAAQILRGAEVKPSILDQIGLTKGICVLPGDEQCSLALDLADSTELLIYVQLDDSKDVEQARRIADQAGFLGRRIFIEQGPANKLHLADNLADVLVMPPNAKRIPQAEALRVLRPEGKALLRDKTIVKPVPEGIDDWSHPYHGPDNNPQSNDTVIVAPYLTHFFAEPRYAPVPQVAVASAGRVFKAFGHVAFKKREEPLLNKLVAFNGYNGTILWQRDLRQGYMVHRNTIIATPKLLYVADDTACSVIDTVTGSLVDTIAPDQDLAGGTFWKWMAMENGTLYAMIGAQEQKDPTKRWNRNLHGWPWDPISEGFNQTDNPWGYGKNLLAIDPKSKKVLWTHREQAPMDGRAVCMKNKRIYIFNFASYLACIDARTGQDIWRKTPDNAPQLFRSLGKQLNRQDWRTNWRTTCYLKCSDDAIYFAGPTIGKLLAVSAKTGDKLWEHPYSNFQLVLQDDILYGISGQIDNHPSIKFAALTGEILDQINQPRRACTRPTGSADAIFFRASGGSVRLDLASKNPGWISPMRPPCHDGVTVANGLLYWWPSVCDCQLTIYGITTLAPAGDFDFTAVATEADRLEKTVSDLTKLRVEKLDRSPEDWPTFRADNQCSAASKAALPRSVSLKWTVAPEHPAAPSAPPTTPPVSVAGLTFVGGPDGVVRAIDSAAGKTKWKAYTGGAVRFPPTISDDRAYVGSADGYAYCLEAATGKLIWRFRAAPAERIIPVYGALASTWPVGAVTVENGIAYLAAGIVNYDGTYLYALDALTGRIIWQNNTSGHLDPQARTGVSLQGHQLIANAKLYLAGGTSISPAVYNIADGKCLNDPAQLAQCNSVAPRGWELSLLADQVAACGKPLYAHPQYDVYDRTVFGKVFLAPAGDKDVVWAADEKNKNVLCYKKIDAEFLKKAMLNPANRFCLNWGAIGLADKPIWARNCNDAVAFAVASDAVVVAEKTRVIALDLADGKVLWTRPLPAPPVTWGVALDRRGQVVITLEDGKVVCFG